MIPTARSLRNPICIFVLLAAAASLNAQVLTIRDQITLEPLDNVAVYSLDPNVSAITDEEGQVDITAFKDAHTIHVKRIGYKKLVASYTRIAKLRFKLQLEKAPLEMDQVVVSATRWQQEMSDIPSKIIVIQSEDAVLQNPQTAADLLGTSGEVFIQKSQLGGGSPMIRGFAANRILLTVDGVRMNTAIFRSGNLQNVISLDPFTNDRTEVAFGPGSLIYGSDAIGAVLNFSTLTPELSPGSGQVTSGSAVIRSSSANFEKTVHVDLSLGLPRWAFLTSATVTDFDDQKMGTLGPGEYLRQRYAATSGGRDTTLINPDPRTQVPTGYHQLNLMQKIRFKPDDRWDVNLAIHYSSTSDYPRYDRLLRDSGDHPRSAEWYYGPQVWSMNALHISHSGQNGLYDDLKSSIAYHYFEESRHDRDYGGSQRRHRTETVDAITANLDLHKSWDPRHHLYYGTEVALNTIGSTGENEDTVTGILVPGPSRYPDGATWNSYAAYLNYLYVPNEKLALQSGLRFNQVTLNAEFDTTYYPFPFSSARFDPCALIGSLGMAFKPDPGTQININLSTGFRAPNVDDVGKVFDSEPGSVVVPNPYLEPEYAYTAELGLTKIFNETLKIDAAAYYTFLDNAMVRRDFTLNGLDSIYYDGELSQVQAIQNAAKATVKGFEAGLEIKLPRSFAFRSGVNVQQGDEELDDGSTAPLRHAAPWFGDTHLTFTRNRFKGDLYSIYTGRISHEDMPPEELSKDYLYAVDANGNPYSPGWYTINFKAIYQVTDDLTLSAGIENITDQRYRPYSSGIAGPGRNFIAALKTSF